MPVLLRECAVESRLGPVKYLGVNDETPVAMRPAIITPMIQYEANVHFRGLSSWAPKTGMQSATKIASTAGKTSLGTSGQKSTPTSHTDQTRVRSKKAPYSQAPAMRRLAISIPDAIRRIPETR